MPNFKITDFRRQRPVLCKYFTETHLTKQILHGNPCFGRI